MATDPKNDHLLEHSYDGIREYDNPLPRWWVWVFWATVMFALAYAFDFTGRLRGPGRIREFETQLADAAKRWPAPTGTIDAAGLAALAKDPRAVAAGKATFVTTCAPCHRADGGGLIGPNLTDDYWLHGGSLVAIQNTITVGVPDKGMPTWGKMLKPEQISDVAVYAASLRGTNPPNPKAPQGVKSEENPGK
jgi:cytochrome c oxidase cbb3-type subunit 3